MIKGWRTLLAGGLLACSVATMLPHIAVATPVPYPEDCRDEPSSRNSWFAICNAGYGRYKASVICEDMQGGPLVMRWPQSWANIGEYSVVFCPPFTTAKSGGILKRHD